MVGGIFLCVQTVQSLRSVQAVMGGCTVNRVGVIHRITRSALANTLGGIFRFWICDFGFSIVRSSDNSVGPGQDIGRDREPDLFCGFEIDGEFELRRLLNGKVGGLCTFEYFVNVSCGA